MLMVEKASLQTIGRRSALHIDAPHTSRCLPDLQARPMTRAPTHAKCDSKDKNCMYWLAAVPDSVWNATRRGGVHPAVVKSGNSNADL